MCECGLDNVQVAGRQSPDITQPSTGNIALFGYVNCLHHAKTRIHFHYRSTTARAGAVSECCLIPHKSASQSFNRFKFARSGLQFHAVFQTRSSL